jgi:hypothetical protein
MHGFIDHPFTYITNEYRLHEYFKIKDGPTGI